MLLNVRRILFVSFVLIHRTCHCIQCYQCDSLKDPNCSISLHPKYLKECPFTHNYCRKINSAYYFKRPTEHIIMRECAALYTREMKCYNGKYNHDGYQQICECRNGRGCNESSLTHSITIPLLITTQIVHQLFPFSYLS